MNALYYPLIIHSAPIAKHELSIGSVNMKVYFHVKND